jgi:hypothetical protein
VIFFDALGVKVRDGALVRNKAALKLMWLALMEDAIARQAAEGAGAVMDAGRQLRRAWDRMIPNGVYSILATPNLRRYRYVES